MKTRKVELPFTQEAESTVCPHCNQEYVIYAIFRNPDGSTKVWAQVGGYCYMCSKDTKEKKCLEMCTVTLMKRDG